MPVPVYRVYSQGMETTNPTTTATFEVGQTYSCRSVCSHDTIWTFTVESRTARFATLVDSWGDRSRVGIKTDDDGEWMLPLGRYSMAPVLRAVAR